MGGLGELLLAGVVMAFNVIIIMIKFSSKRFADAFLDLTLFIFVAWFTSMSGTMSGVVIGMSASAVISFYLMMHPIKRRNKYIEND